MTKRLATAFIATLLTAGVSLAGRCGDVNRDGAVDIGDALMVAQYAQGMRACGTGAFVEPRMCDVNLDGRCDMLDAEMMVECDMGMTSCEFDCHPFKCLHGQRKLGH